MTAGWSWPRPWPAQIGTTRPLAMMWTVWALLAAATYERAAWSATRLLLHPVQSAGETIALARRSGWSTAATITLVTVLRLAIHTYYSWGSLFVLLWIPAGYALYRAAGSIWPLIVGHAVYDAIQFSIDSWPPAGNVLVVVNLTFALVGAVVVFVGYNRYWRGRQDGRRSQPAAAT